ncbi:MAG: hypothetical protein AAF420_01155 [Pseudomonadota bacterium]
MLLIRGTAGGKARPGSAKFRDAVNHTESCDEQIAMVQHFFENKHWDQEQWRAKQELSSAA